MIKRYNGMTCRTIAVLLLISAWNALFASVSVKVFSFEEAVSEGNISRPRIFIKNTGTEIIDNFTYRYFFDTENGQAPMVEPYYLTDKEQIMLVPYGSGYYVQYTITNANLTPGGLMPHSLGNCIGLHYNNWSTWNKSNDFSNNQSSSFIENQNISVYVAGTRIFGNEPGSGSGGVESGYAWREVWTNINGTSTNNIPVSTTPNLSGPLFSLDEPKQYGDNFGSRIRGYITAPLSGSYTFWIASDDDSRFYLSTDENPANKGTSPIAWITDGYTSSSYYEWNKYSTQKSIEKALTAGTKYYFEILHKDAAQDDNCSVGWLKPGESGSVPSEIVPSAVLSPYFVAEAPAAPVNLTATAVSSSRIDLSWTDASINECSFSIQMKNGSEEFTDIAIVSANQTSYQVTGLTSEINYMFRIRACNTYGYSDYSNTAQNTTFAIVLGGATRELWMRCAGYTVAEIPVNTTPIDIKQIDSLESTQQSADYFGRRIRGYIIPPNSGNYTFWIASDDCSQLWLSTNDQASSKVLIASVSGYTSYREWNKYSSQKSNVQTLNAGVRYYFEILHKEGNQDDNLSVGWIKPGQSGSVPSQIVPKSALSPFIIQSIPAAPGGLIATAISATQIDLTWMDNSNNESGFFIERAVAGGTFIQISSAASNSGIYHDAGLTANTQYQYRIRSFNDLGSSGYSNTASAVTSEPGEKTPSTVNLTSFAIYSTEKTTIGSRCHFFGNGGAVGSNKVVEILPDDTVHGNVVSGGTISILDRDLIDGDVIAAGTITVNSTATVRGEVQPNAAVAMLTIPTIATIPTGDDSVLVGDRQSRILLPGCYDRITVLNNATLTLFPGIYTCKNLFIGPDAHIILDVTSADIVDVQVTGDVEFSDRCNVSFKEEGKGYVPFIRFYTNSSNIVRIGCNVLLNGMLIAPNGHLLVNSRTRCNGALYGKYITIEPDAGFLSDDITSQCEDSDGDHVANILEVLMGTNKDDANDFIPIAVPSTVCIDNSQEVTITYDYSIFYPEFDGAKNVSVTFPPHSLTRENIPLIIQVKNIPSNGQIFDDSVTYAQLGRYFEFTNHNSIVAGKSAIIGFPMVEDAVYPSTSIMQNIGLGFFGAATTTCDDGNTVYASVSSNEPIIIAQKAEGKQTFYFDDGTIYSNNTNSVLNYDFVISIEGASGTETATATINYTDYTTTTPETRDLLLNLSKTSLQTTPVVIDRLGVSGYVARVGKIVINSVTLSLSTLSNPVVLSSDDYTIYPGRTLSITADFTPQDLDLIASSEAVPDNKLSFSYSAHNVIFESSEIGGEGRIMGDLATSTPNYHYQYFLKDHLGSTRMVLTEDASITEAIMYQPYGTMSDPLSITSEIAARNKFTGKEFDLDGGTGTGIDGVRLNYFGARYYDADIGLWTSCDPKHQFWSPYSYTGNGVNPLIGVDPNGKDIHVLIWKSNPNTKLDNYAQHAAIAVDLYAKNSNGKIYNTGKVAVHEFGPAEAVGISNAASNVPGYYGTEIINSNDLANWTGAFEENGADNIITISGNEKTSQSVAGNLSLFKALNKMYNGLFKNCTDFTEKGVQAAGNKVGSIISQPETLEKQLE